MGNHHEYEGHEQEKYNEVLNSPHHQAHFSHELIGGAAGFAAMKAYEEHQKKNGKPVSHQLAKELALGFAMGELTKLFESKGMDAIDRKKAEHEAKKHIEERLNEQHY